MPGRVGGRGGKERKGEGGREGEGRREREREREKHEVRRDGWKVNWRSCPVQRLCIRDK